MDIEQEYFGKKIIGLTGGIGSGKTTVAKFIEELGFPMYYSDERAKDIAVSYTHLDVYKRQGFIIRTPRGREVTEKAYQHLKISKPKNLGELF